MQLHGQMISEGSLVGSGGGAVNSSLSDAAAVELLSAGRVLLSCVIDWSGGGPAVDDGAAVRVVVFKLASGSAVNTRLPSSSRRQRP